MEEITMFKLPLYFVKYVQIDGGSEIDRIYLSEEFDRIAMFFATQAQSHKSIEVGIISKKGGEACGLSIEKIHEAPLWRKAFEIANKSVTKYELRKG